MKILFTRMSIITLFLFLGLGTLQAQTVDAGLDVSICVDNTNMAAVTPGAGYYGAWSVKDGVGTFTNPNLINSEITGLGVGINTLLWTVYTTPGDAFVDDDEVIITNNAIYAHAGPDKEVCSSPFTLEGNDPSTFGATGTWTIVSGNGTMADDTYYGCSIDEPAEGLSTFRWTLNSSAGCTSADDVNITNNIVTANAGTDQQVCHGSAFFAAETPPGGATAMWKVISGNGVFANVNSNSTQVTDLAIGENVFEWKVMKSGCVDADSVLITNNEILVDAGTDQSVYDAATTILTANATIGSDVGTWTLTNGVGALITTMNNPTTGITNLASGSTYVFTWTIEKVGGACDANFYSDDVEVTVGSTATATGGGTGTWNDPAAWEGDVPGENDIVNIAVSLTITGSVVANEIIIGATGELTVENEATFGELFINTGGALIISANSAKGFGGSLTTRGLTIEPDPAKKTKAVTGLRIGRGGSLTIEPDPAKKSKAFGNRIGGSLTIEPDPAKKGSALRVRSGSNLTVASGGSLTIEPDPAKNKTTGVVVIEEGAYLVLEEGSNLLNQNDGSAIQSFGNIQIPLNITPNAWHFYSLPIVQSSVNVFDGTWVRTYNEASNEWDLLAWGDQLTALNGYIVWANNPVDVTLEGDLNAGEIEIQLQQTGIPAEDFGFNFVGNPYQTIIDWTLDGFNKDNITGAMYVWDQTLNTNIGGYAAHTGVVGVPEAQPVILSNQGFFVQATGNNVAFSINPNAQVNPAKKYTAPKTPNDIIRFSLKNGDYTDEIAIYFDENATPNYDLYYDANKFMDGGNEKSNAAPQLYSITPEGNKLTIDVTNLKGLSTLSIPLGMNLNTSTELSLNAFAFENFDQSISLYIEDTQESVMQNLRTNPNYIFNKSEGVNDDRFVLHLSSVPTAVDNSDLENSFSIFSNKKNIFIDLGKDNNAQVEIYSIIGKKVMSKELLNSGIHTISTNLQTGNYLIKLKVENKVISRKVFIE